MSFSSPPRRPGDANPPPLTVAASLAAVEGMVLLALGVVEVVSVQGERAAVGITTALFFAAYGVLLLACGWALSRRRSWARGPVLITQLIALGMAWTLREYVLVAIALAMAGLVALAGMLHPASVEALQRTEED